MYGTIAIEQYLEEEGVEIPENSLVKDSLGVSQVCRDATQNMKDVSPENVKAFIRSLPNWVASREIESRNIHMPDGHFDHNLYVTEDEQTGALFKFSFNYRNNPRSQYEGRPYGGDIKGDKEKYKKATHGKIVE